MQFAVSRLHVQTFWVALSMFVALFMAQMLKKGLKEHVLIAGKKCSLQSACTDVLGCLGHVHGAIRVVLPKQGSVRAGFCVLVRNAVCSLHVQTLWVALGIFVALSGWSFLNKDLTEHISVCW